MEWEGLVFGYGSSWTVKLDQEQIVFTDELKRRRARGKLYTGFKWLVSFLLFASAALFLINSFLKTDNSDFDNDFYEQAILRPERVSGSKRADAFNFIKMIDAMEEYSALVNKGEVGAPWAKRPLKKLKTVLANLVEQQKFYCEHLEKDRKSLISTQNRKKKQASLHYQRSLENAIADLKEIISQEESRSH
jgi:hypothetical protein